MKGNKFLLPIILCCMGMFSCGKSLSPDDFVGWMENERNGLRKTKNETETTFIVQYKNSDYIQYKRKSEVVSEDMDLIKKSSAEMLLFDLFITCQGGLESPLTYKVLSKQEADSRYYHYYFKMAEDIWAEEENKTIRPVYCEAEKSVGFNNTLAFRIGFKKSDFTTKRFKLVLNDTFLGNGILKFGFSMRDIDNIPEIKK